MTDQIDADVGDSSQAPDSVGTAAQPEPAAATGERQRVSHWDRPPDPHDWRFFVGGLGKILITIGLLMFGFVAYQLWGTGIETARAQNQLESEFDELVASNLTTSDTAGPPATTAPDVAPLGSSDQASSDATGSSPPPTTVAAPAVIARPGVVQNIPPIERGEPLAKLEIPKIGKTGGDALYVVPGVTHEDLKKGPGHYPDTPLPGQLGNASIAGHRTTFGEPFRNVDQLEPGDEIIVTMANGEQFVYAVTSTEIVGPDDYYVVTTTDPTVAMLTLTSCHPVYTARQRIAVHAILVPDESAPVGVATYYDLEDTADEDGNDSVVTDSGEESSDVVDDVTSEATSDETTSDSVDIGSDLSTTPVGDNGDAFEGGWFDDSDAWPQIALWGAALIAIALMVRWLSRRFRSYLIGIAIGIVPFVFCLYFFYQNINRLLPPGL